VVDRLKLFLLIAVAWQMARLASAQPIPAFPGAEGAGAIATGGRGGIVYHVTTLAADHPAEPTIVGSLRYGLKNERFLDESGNIIPRTIVFDVGGAINLGGVDWDFRVTNVTIAGQTAPGGIALINGEFNPGGNNAIMRNFTVRRGEPLTTEKDAVWLNGANTIVDHITASWQTDEGISVTDGANNVTVQYSIISEGLSHADGGDGSSIEGNTPGARSTFHHNLYAHNKSRIPRRGEKEGPGDTLDFRNNVIYNWSATSAGTAPSASERSFTNVVNNYYIRGFNNGSTVFNSAGPIHQFFQNGNLLDSDRDGVADGVSGGNNGWDHFTGTETQMPTPFAVPHGVTQSAEEALQTVLNYSGAHWWSRSATDARIIEQVKTYGNSTLPTSQKGQVISAVPADEWNALVALASNPPPFVRQPDFDTDNDGMPDDWERKHGLTNGVTDHNGDFDSDGYTNLEEYINEIAEWPAPDPIVFGGDINNRYAQITNWNISRTSPGEADTVTHWQPSRYDEAQINSGTAVVDAVGQHADVLVIATNNGDTAQLDITDGWLLANNVVVIGGSPMASGTLNLSGGLLATPLLAKGDAGMFSFTGGTLHAAFIDFDLVNNGGILSTGHSFSNITINGNFQINSGMLHIELAGSTSYEAVLATGSVTLGGELVVAISDDFVPESYDVFTIVTGDAISGTFANLSPVGRIAAPSGSFLVTVGANHVTLSDFRLTTPVLAGDYNDDGVVDAADYVVWRKHLATDMPLANETVSLGQVDQDDYDAWRANFGATNGSGNSLIDIAPEPTAALLVLVGLSGALSLRACR